MVELLSNSAINHFAFGHTQINNKVPYAISLITQSLHNAYALEIVVRSASPDFSIRNNGSYIFGHGNSAQQII